MIKKSGSMATIFVKKENTDRGERPNHNRVSIKTEVSSKMNSIMREDQRSKKGKKKGVPGKKDATIKLNDKKGNNGKK